MDRNNIRHTPYNNGIKSRPLPPRYSPPQPEHNNNNNQHTNQQDDIIHYIYEAWNKVSRDAERGNEHTRYYHEPQSSRHLNNFRPFNLEEWWGRRLMETLKHQQHS